MNTKNKYKEYFDKIIEQILNAGLSVAEMSNNSDSSNVVNHIVIIGGKRRVNYWPTTQTIYCDGIKGKARAIKLKNMPISKAIAIAKKGID